MNTRLNTRLNARLNTKMQKTSCPNKSSDKISLESEMKREQTSQPGKHLNLPNQLYTVDINFDEASVKPKWDDSKKEYFTILMNQLKQLESWEAISIETIFKEFEII